MLNLSLAWKFFWRDWKSGELRILMVALWIAVGGLTAVTLLVDRIDRGMVKEASQVLGADRVVASPREIDPEIEQFAQTIGLNRSQEMRFSSVVIAKDEFQLTSVRAVDQSFPLAGELRIAEKPFTEGVRQNGGPMLGEVWVSSRLLQLLNIEIGDQLQIGVAFFRVSGVIVKEPGGSSFFNFSPTVMMNLAEVNKTEIIQPGSRLHYRLLLSGDETALNTFDQWVTSKLDSTQSIQGVDSGAPALGSALGKAKNFLDLSGILGLILGGIAIAITANRYAIRHFSHSALLRCLGLKKDQVVLIFSLVLFIAGVFGSLLGILSGYLVNELLRVVLVDLLPAKMPAPSLESVVIGFVTGLTVLLGFAFPALVRIRKVTPMRILRKDLDPMLLSQWLVIALAVFTLSLVLYWYAQSVELVLVIVIGGSVLTAVSLTFASGLLKVARLVASRRSIAIKFGVGHLQRHKSASLIQISAFGLTLTLLLVILLVRNELIADWKAQLPADAPNHFAVNIQPEEVPDVSEFFDRQSIKATSIFPMVRGRITQINLQDPKSVLSEKAQKHNSLRRDLNLTWASAMPSSNQILSGSWEAQDSTEVMISLEQEMAKALELDLGDSITFTVGADEITGVIGSLRKVDWDSFEPNFYVIFNPGTLENLPSTYITSFYLSPEQKLLLNTMVHRFPTVSVIELDLILNEVRNVLDKASIAVEMVLVFVILAGLAVLFATNQATLDEKQYESALLKTLGAQKTFIRKTTLVEYWIMGLLAGLLAAIASEGLAYFLYQNVFKMTPEWHGWIWLSAPLLGLLIVVPAGIWGNRGVLSLPPAVILKQVDG